MISKNMIKWCFSTLGCTERSLNEVIFLAQRYGISALEIRGINGELNNEKITDFETGNIEATRQKLKENEILPLVLGTSVSFHDENAFDKNIEDGKKAIELASQIGFSAVRVFGNSIVGDEEECIRRVAEGVKKLCMQADKKGISVLLEVHGDFNTAKRLLPIAEYCSDTKSFGLIWDICHTHKVYGENWRLFYSSLSPYVKHVHLKDVKDGKQVLPGDGELPIVDVVTHMLNGGYSGYFSLEWERYWRRDLPEIECALDNLFSLFS